MKKTFIALAVLSSVATFAQAQSSVTLYGRVDAGLASVKTLGVTQTKIDNGGAVGLTTSRWGMRGTEDLGGGLKASFKLESRFNVDDGTFNSSTRLFHGESFVALNGGFGTVKVGRLFTAFDDLRAIAVSRSLWDSAFTPTGDAYSVGGDYAARSDNAIRYDSNSFSGFSGAVMYGLGENKTATLSASNQLSLHVKYANGPILVGYGYQKETNVGGKSTKYNAISGAYDFGVASISAGFNTRNGDDLGTGKDNEYTLGVNVPMGAINLSAGYANAKTKVANATSKGSGFGIGATYSLSKRTTLYTGYKTTNVENNVGVRTLENRLLSAGVRHDF